MPSSSRSILLFMLLSSVAWAVPGYLPHQPNPDLFRLDLISLTQSQMEAASRHLVTLAKRPDATSPKDLRTTAQLIALAERLSPSSKTPQQLSKIFQDKDKKAPQASPEDVEKSKELLISYIEWLLDEKASPESQNLGALLLDPLFQIDQNQPLTKNHDPLKQGPRWKEVVPSIAAYRKAQPTLTPKDQPKELATNTPREDNKNPGELFPTKNDQGSDSPLEKSDEDLPEVVFVHKNLRLKTPLVIKNNSGTRVVRLLELSLDIRDTTEKSFELKASPGSNLLSNNGVRRLLKSSWTQRPKQAEAYFKVSKPTSNEHNENLVAAPMAALLQAATTEGTLRKNLIVVGQLTSEGKLTAPKRMWTILRSLKTVKKSRIIIPRESAVDFAAFLVLKTPEFFLTNEICTADNLQDLLELSIIEKQSKNQAEALALFAEIREVAETKDIRDLATNSHVRERLEKIKTLHPEFINSSLLLLQGSGNRPTKYSTSQLAQEAETFHLFLRPVAVNYSTYELDRLALKSKEELFGDKLNELKKLTAYGDQEMLDKIETLHARLRTLTRELRSHDYEDHERKKKAFDSFKEVYKQLARDFAQLYDEKPDAHFFKQNGNPNGGDQKPPFPAPDADPF